MRAKKLTIFVICTMILEMRAFSLFGSDVKSEISNTLESNAVELEFESNRFTAPLIQFLGLSSYTNNARGPTHDTPPTPCSCSK